MNPLWEKIEREARQEQLGLLKEKIRLLERELGELRFKAETLEYFDGEPLRTLRHRLRDEPANAGKEINHVQ